MASIDSPACPASCDDQNDCTIDSCDPISLQCVHTPSPAGTSCNAHDVCTTNDVCSGPSPGIGVLPGICLSGTRKVCAALDQCHQVGVCQQATGQCSNPIAPNGKVCDDGLFTTTGDQCQSGACKGTPVLCSNGVPPDTLTGSCPDGFPNTLSARVIQNAWGPTNGNGLVRAADGRIFVAGSFYVTTDLGSGPIKTLAAHLADDYKDIFVAQLDASTGKAMWTQGFHGDNRHDVTSVALSGVGTLGLVGTYTGTLTVGSTDLDTTSLGDDQYILGVSVIDGGTGAWVRRVNLKADTSKIKTALPTGLRGIAGDPKSAAFVVCGTTTKDATDLSTSLAGAWRGGQDIVLASIDGTTAATTWAKQVGGPNDENCTAVATDAQSNVYLLGTYRFGSNPDFGEPVPLPMLGDPGSTWAFLTKLDSAGTGKWSLPLGGEHQVVVATAMLSVGSDVIVAGTLTSATLSLNGVDLGGSSTFLVKIDGTNGSITWIKGLGAGGNVAVTAMAEGANGAILLTGKYFSGTKLGDIPLPPPNGFGGMFVAQMGSDGAIKGARGYGDPSQASLPAGVIGRTDGQGSEQGSSLLLGFFQSKIDLGPKVGLITNSSTDLPQSPAALFVAKVAP